MNGQYFCLSAFIVACGLFEVSFAQSSSMMEAFQQCCAHGKSAAEDLDPNPCEDVGIPDDIDDSLQALCSNSATVCCKDQLESQDKECQAGQRHAVAMASCEDLNSEKEKICCDQCKLGQFAGQSGIVALCKSSNFAFQACCENIINESEETNTTEISDPNNNEINSILTTNVVPTSNSVSPFEASICEQYAPDELCAHHCIAIPGSYKCECRSGFVLMADGKSCKKIEIDRCKTNNPCEQRCIDSGREVKCLCRKGYELMDDLKSCIDVDECAVKTHRCTQNEKCVNTIGSHKCESLQGADQNQKRVAPVKTCPPGFDYNRQKQVCDDIDECLDKNTCRETSICTNTIGSFKCSFDAGQPVTPKRWNSGHDSEEVQCPPGFTFDPDTAECIDVDECVQGLDDCNRMSQICLNTNGKFTCQDKVSKTNCPPGFKINPANSSCEDINECLESNDLCAWGTECVNEPGGYDCKRIQSSSQNRGLNTPPRRTNNGIIKTPISVQRGKKDCPAGYRQYHGSCQEIDECSDGSHTCDTYQECENTRGSYICKCKLGFRLDNITLACVDINECESEHLNQCLDTQRCDNTIGSYHCSRYISCGTGYTLNAMSNLCEDNDECASGQNDCAIIGKDYSCINLPGTFRCLRRSTPSSTRSSTPSTRPYYNGESLDDGEYYDEVSGEYPEGASAQSVYNNSKDFVPSTIRPPTYYSPNQSSTQKTSSNMSPPSKVDNDTYGIVVVNASQLPVNQWNFFVNQPLEKHCIAGYIMNSKGDCVDVDECKTGKHMCNSQSELCVNRIGSYTCNCVPGLLRNSSTGICGNLGASEEATPTSITDPATPILVTPTSTVKYSQPHIWNMRSCDVGYHYDTTLGKCVDTDECTERSAVCATEGEMCVNTVGGYRCECLPGWYIDHVRHRCVPRHMKIQPGPIYTGVPVVKTYSVPAPSRVAYTVRRTSPRTVMISRCQKGYKYDDEGGRCIDVDECAADPPPCAATQACSNMVGGYICRCPTGHKIVGDVCVDIDECVQFKGKVCSINSRCINTIGSYRCECNSGFEQSEDSDRLCQDRDECSTGEAACEDICVNVWGSFRCACQAGFKLASNNKTCNDVDECTEFAERNICVGQCINEPGSYTCGCPTGYRLAADNRNCIDIDECDPRDGSSSPCPGPNQVCQNTRGGYKCYNINCPKGYIKQDTSKNRCIRAPNACVAGVIDCTKTPDTYSYNFITFVSRLYIPPPPRAQVDLFTMRGPTWPGAELNFSLRLLKVDAPSSVTQPATLNSFLLTSTQQQAMVSLVKSLQGPQDIELELVMELFTKRTFEGTAVAKIFIYVSPYEF